MSDSHYGDASLGPNPDAVTNGPPDLTNAVAVAVGYAHAIALRPDGTLVGWGASSYVPPDLPFVTGVAAYHDLSRDHAEEQEVAEITEAETSAQTEL